MTERKSSKPGSNRLT